MPKQQPQEVLSDEDAIERWAFNPEAFFDEVLGFKPTSQQRQGLEELRKLVTAKIKRSEGLSALTPEEEVYAKKRGLSIMSGQGTGKDAFTAGAIIWFLSCFPYPKIPCTAPTGHQLKDVLWAEISKWLRQSLVADLHTWQSDKVFLKASGGREWFAVARTTNPKATEEAQAETLAGFHEDYMMIVVDEASGVATPVFRPLEGTLTGKCNFVLLIFNPTRATGFAIESQQKNREDWICLHWDAEESERVEKDHIEAMARKFGRDSNTFRVRVKGLPPKSDPDTLIPWDWVMDCVEIDLMPAEDDPVVIGIDVARYGDDKSIILVRHGPIVLPLQDFRKIDTEELSGWAMGEIAKHGEDLAAVFIDTIGIGGGVADKLHYRTTGIEIVDVCVSELPSREDKFRRLRDELWWNMRLLFEKRAISIPNDDELIAELTTPRYDHGDDGKIRVDSKKKMKERVDLQKVDGESKSPNKADALALTTYYSRDMLRSRFFRKSQKKKEVSIGSWRTV